MFCDLVGSTVLAQRFDAEDMSTIVRSFTQTTSDICRSYDGHVTRFLGDAVLCYFGYPRALEDASHRAIAASLDIIQAVSQLKIEPDLTLQCRVGLAYGDVVTNETIQTDFGSETIAVGNTPNLAARLQDIAEPNSVVVTDRIHSLTQDTFRFEDAGLHELKGFSNKQQAWKVAEVLPAHLRATSSNANARSLLGRMEELQTLKTRWQKTLNHHGQLIQIGGLPGIGKSHFLAAFKQHLVQESQHGEGLHWIELRCKAIQAQSILQPIVDFLHSQAKVEPGDNDPAALDKMRDTFGQQTQGVSEDPQFIALCHLLNLDSLVDHGSEALTPRELKQNLFGLFTHWIVNKSLQIPVVVAVEDVHWADSTTVEWLLDLLSSLTHQRVCLIVTNRPEFEAPWSIKENVTAIFLDSLNDNAARNLINDVSHGKRLPEELLKLILNRADKVPLFIETMTRSILESEQLVDKGDHYAIHGTLNDIGIPDSLQDSLMARLDHSDDTLTLAQLAAVIGRYFSVSLLNSVAREQQLGDGQWVAATLDTLQDRQLVQPPTEPLSDQWSFCHSLMRDAAYSSLLRRHRRQLHQSVAIQLDTTIPELKDSTPHLLAYHYSEGGDKSKAVPLWQLAGEKAVGLWANQNAVNHYQQALKDINHSPSLTAQPVSANQLSTELTIRLALGNALRNAKGSSHPDTIDAYESAVALCAETGTKEQMIRAYYGVFVSNFTAARLRAAKRAADELLSISQTHDSIVAQVAGYQATGIHAFATGQFDVAYYQLKQALQIGNDNQIDGKDMQFPVLCESYLSWTLHWLGKPDEARDVSERAISNARSSSPYDLALSLANACYLRQFQDDPQHIKVLVSELHSVAQQRALPAWDAVAAFFDCWADCQLAPDRANLARLVATLDLWETDEIETPYFKTLVAQTQFSMQQYESGANLLQEAETLMLRTGERWYYDTLQDIKHTY